MPLRIELPPTWQAVGLEHDGGTDLAAFRQPAPGESFTPNLTLLTRRSPLDVGVRTLADRALGATARESASISVFTEKNWGSGRNSMVLRGFLVTAKPSADDQPALLTRFHLHAGLPPEHPDHHPGQHDVAALVLSCTPAQRALVEQEFTDIVRSIAVDG